MNKLKSLEQTNCRLEISPGWYSLVEELLQTIDAIIEDYQLPQIKYTQIKQKFTGLRVYYKFEDDTEFSPSEYQLEGFATIRELIDTYEWIAKRTCTLTGLPGKQVVIGSFYTVLHKSLFKENKKNEQCYTNKGLQLTNELYKL